jgi:2',3'-cyclic-nucleotide 2'-phosphodiesterase/3'-nucleotidase
MKSIPFVIFCTASTLLLGCNNSNTTPIPTTKVNTPINGTKVDIRLLETVDIHANLLNFNYFSDEQDDKVGLVKTTTLIRQSRAQVSNSLLIDNGDLLQGSPLGDYIAKIKGLTPKETHPIYKAMNALNYDVANIGNHEFNFGVDFLMEATN